MSVDAARRGLSRSFSEHAFVSWAFFVGFLERIPVDEKALDRWRSPSHDGQRDQSQNQWSPVSDSAPQIASQFVTSTPRFLP